MARLFNILFLVATASVFLLGAQLLDLVHWQYTDDSGPLLTRIHPATYIIILTTIVATFAFPRRVMQAVSSLPFILFAVATLILFARAVIIMLTGITGGEVTAVVTNFMTPALYYVCARCVSSEVLLRWEWPLRAFFVANSLMALAERLVGHRFIPGFLDKTKDMRASALVAHPLNGSLLTGLLLVYLVTARRGESKIANRLPEIALHAAAMFAFGGRAALVFTPTIMILSAFMSGRKAGEADVTWSQRLMPLSIVLIGICLIFLPIEFVDSTLDRFSNDGNSAQTRNAAIDILFYVPPHDLLFGMNYYDRMAMAKFFHTPAGLELAWAALTITYGLLCVLPMMIALPWLFYSMTRQMDRSAFYMMLLFLVVTAGSLAFGVKSLVVVQCVAMIQILGQRKLLRRKANVFDELGISVRPPRSEKLFGNLSE